MTQEGNLEGYRYKDLLNNFVRIHPDAKLGKNVTIGRGTVIEAGCEIGDNTRIGHNVVLRPNTIIGKNCSIGHCTVSEGDNILGDRSNISSNCHFGRYTVIKEDCFLGPGTVTVNTKRIVHGRNIKMCPQPPIIERAVRIGGRCFLLPGVHIGENAFIGGGSTVVKDVPPRQVWFGCPARYHKDVPKEEIL